MRSRTAAALLSSLGVIGTGAAFAAPALAAASPDPAVVDSTVPDPSDPSTPDDATAEEEAAPAAPADDEAAAGDEDSSPFDEHLSSALQPLIDDGTITQEQADAVIEALADSFPRVRVERFPIAGGFALDTLAEALGLPAEEIREAIGEGGSIADLAESAGVELQSVIDALVASASERLDEAVADGRLTAEQAEERLAELTERITAMVEQVGLAGGIGVGIDWSFPGGDGPMWHQGGRPGRRLGGDVFPGLGIFSGLGVFPLPGVPGSVGWPSGDVMGWPHDGPTFASPGEPVAPESTPPATESTSA